MRILVISNYYPPFEIGGWEQLTFDVVQQLMSRGHKIFVITSSYRSNQLKGFEPDVARILHLESPDHLHYHAYYTLIHRWRERQNRQYLARAVNDFCQDIIFINGMWNLPHSVAQESERLCPGKTVYYIASGWPTDLDPHTAYWTEPAARPWLRLPKQWVSNLVRRTVLSGIKSINLTFSHVLCVSAYIQRYMVNEVKVPPSQTHVVYNGINVDEFTPSGKISEPQATLQLLYAGGFLEHKGIHTALEAIGHLINQLAFTNIHLTLIGSGHPSYVQFLKDRIRALGIEGFVTFGNRVPRSRMPSLLKNYDVLLFPSIWPEPLARMTQEAMASGLVVIGTTTGGTPELLHDGDNGLTFEAGNAPMMAEKIWQVAKDPDLRRRLAQSARKTVEERFTIDRMVDEVESYLLSVKEGIDL